MSAGGCSCSTSCTRTRSGCAPAVVQARRRPSGDQLGGASGHGCGSRTRVRRRGEVEDAQLGGGAPAPGPDEGEPRSVGRPPEVRVDAGAAVALGRVAGRDVDHVQAVRRRVSSSDTASCVPSGDQANPSGSQEPLIRTLTDPSARRSTATSRRYGEAACRRVRASALPSGEKTSRSAQPAAPVGNEPDLAAGEVLHGDRVRRRALQAARLPSGESAMS